MADPLTSFERHDTKGTSREGKTEDHKIRAFRLGPPEEGRQTTETRLGSCHLSDENVLQAEALSLEWAA
jgi:hypothetical protein